MTNEELQNELETLLTPTCQLPGLYAKQIIELLAKHNFGQVVGKELPTELTRGVYRRAREGMYNAGWRYVEMVKKEDE